MPTPTIRQQRTARNRRVVRRTKPWLPPMILWTPLQMINPTTVRMSLAPGLPIIQLYGIPPIRTQFASQETPVSAAINTGYLDLTYTTPPDPTEELFRMDLPSYELRSDYGAILAPGFARLVGASPPAPPIRVVGWAANSIVLSQIDVNLAGAPTGHEMSALNAWTDDTISQHPIAANFNGAILSLIFSGAATTGDSLTYADTGLDAGTNVYETYAPQTVIVT